MLIEIVPKALIEEGCVKNHIPAYMIEGLDNWINRRIMPGSFLSAVLKNDLKGSYNHADYINKSLLYNYVSFLTEYAPMLCWGSEENVKNWAWRTEVKKIVKEVDPNLIGGA